MTTFLVKIKEDTMPLYNKVKDFRLQHGMNQQELGSKIGVSRQTISLIERGDYNPSITVCLKLAHILGTTVEGLFQYEEDDNEEKR